MQQFPQLMVDHGLDLEADERAVKRAYAKDLKKIDQGIDPAGFQSLRESYEYALAWLRRRDMQHDLQSNHQIALHPSVNLHDANALVPEDNVQISTDKVPLFENEQSNAVEFTSDGTHQSHSETVTADIDSAEMQAKAVFGELLVHLKERKLNASQALDVAMADPRLILIEAATLFEWLVATHLANGWQLDNADLFDAAIPFFKWDHDKQRLLRFGEVGHYIDQALTEKAAFSQLRLLQSDYILRFIQKLQSEQRPSDKYLIINMFLLENLIRQYPAWLPMVTSKKNIEQWREWGNKLEYNEKLPTVFLESKRSPDLGKQFPVGLIIFFLFLSIRFLAGLPSNSPSNTNIHSPIVSTVQHATTSALIEPVTPDEMFDRGEDYLFGRDHLKQDINETIRYWSMAAEKGDVQSQNRLGLLLYDGKYITPNYEQSLKWLLMAAKNGKNAAQFVVGIQYQMGLGTSVDINQAKYWYQKAADGSNSMAQNNLAVLLLRDSPPDCVKGIHLYELATSLGNQRAKSNLGVLYLDGTCGVHEDKSKGVRFIIEAAQAGDAHAEYVLGMIYERGTAGPPLDFDQAVTWYAKSAAQHDADAEKHLHALCQKKMRFGCPVASGGT